MFEVQRGLLRLPHRLHDRRERIQILADEADDEVVVVFVEAVARQADVVRVVARAERHADRAVLGEDDALLVGGQEIGWFGELHPLVAREWDLGGAAVMELELDRLLALHPAHVRWLFQWAPTYLQPGLLRDHPSLEQIVQIKLDILTEKGDLAQARHGATVQIAGNVICRQRPGTAKGFVFISLEDETGVANAIVDPDLFERYRLVVTEEAFMRITGEVQNSDGVVLIKARKLEPLAHEELPGSDSHDFH